MNSETVRSWAVEEGESRNMVPATMLYSPGCAVGSLKNRSYIKQYISFKIYSNPFLSIRPVLPGTVWNAIVSTELWCNIIALHRTMMTSSNGNIFRVTGLCAGNSAVVTGEFPSQSPTTRSFDVFSDRRLNIQLSKQSWGWWFETPSCPLWRHSNGSRRA